MSGKILPVLVAALPDGGTIVCAPKVGIWSAPPRNGSVVAAGSVVGRLTQLRHRFELVIPDGVAGRVEIQNRLDDLAPVAYGAPLFRIVATGPALAAVTTGRPQSSAQQDGDGLKVLAPTDGVFYRSPAKGARPYVVAGDRIATGQPVGLIEVMKTFNPIAYGGPELPDEAEVVELVAADEAEVRAGQLLVIVKKL